MSELDPRLAGLLRRGPPPPTELDGTHRAAIAASARQSWFRHGARDRRSMWTFVAAAGLAAGLAGWMLRAGLDDARLPEVQAMATNAQPATAVAASAMPESMPAAAMPPPAPSVDSAERRDIAPMPFRPLAAAEEAPGDADLRARQPKQDAAGLAMHDASAPALDALPSPAAPPAAIDGIAGPATATAAGGREAAKAEMETRVVAEAPVAMAKRARAEAGAGIDIPVDAPQRGRLLAAAAVLDAVETRRLAQPDRSPALRAALDGIEGIAHPAAEALRRRLRAALAGP